MSQKRDEMARRFANARNGKQVSCNFTEWERSWEGYGEGWDAALLHDERVLALYSALIASYKQQYGKDHNWAGQWVECQSPSHDKQTFSMGMSGMYATGGNWLSLEDRCPQCQALEALTQYRESVKK